MSRLNSLHKRKAARLKWSRNANAAKARKRMASKRQEEPAKAVPFFPWEITVKHLLSKEMATFRPRSGRHAKAALDALFANYQ
jgi:hypothetical protein